MVGYGGSRRLGDRSGDLPLTTHRLHVPREITAKTTDNRGPIFALSDIHATTEGDGSCMCCRQLVGKSNGFFSIDRGALYDRGQPTIVAHSKAYSDVIPDVVHA